MKSSKNSRIQKEWNLTHLCKNDKDALEQLSLVSQKVQEFVNRWKNRKDYLERPNVLSQALKEYEQLSQNYTQGGAPYYYASLKLSLYKDDNNVKALYNKVLEEKKKNDNALVFFENSISKIPHNKQAEFLAASELQEYKHFLESLFLQAKYILSDAEEKIINTLSDKAYDNWVEMLEEFLTKAEKKVQTNQGVQLKTFEEILNLTSDIDRQTRSNAAKAFNKLLKDNLDVAEHEINTVLGYKKSIDELRGFTRPDESRHINDDIDSSTVDALIKAVSENFDISRKFYQLKAKILGQDKIYYYERNVPISFSQQNKTYEYDEAYDLVLKVLSNLDSELADILDQFNRNGLIDVYPRKGKRTGAACYHMLISQPTYIILNHTNQLKDVLTLAHEVGHGVNNELIKKQQNAVNFGTPISTAEVASTFLEDFVLEYLMRDCSDEERLELIFSKLNDEVSSIFRQVALYMFEQELHDEYRKKGYLSATEIGKLFGKHMKAYLGDYVIFDDEAENWWVYWSHIRYFFYVYSYASGLIISKSMQSKVRRNKDFMQKVKQFLAVGLSKKPKEIFLELGINIDDSNFWSEGLNEVRNLLEEAEALARKLNKI